MDEKPRMDETISLDSDYGKKLAKMAKSSSRFLLMEDRTYPLVSKITLGREKENDIAVDDKMASRSHAVIQKIKENYYITDLESRNGTYVNNLRVDKGKYVKLVPGDIIRIGNTNVAVR
jgi:pSer/pThr/pTyr-binding forkhead associated (FHA) protein